MNQNFEYSWAIKPDLKNNQTTVTLEIPLPGGIQDFQKIGWESYYQDCRKNLLAITSQKGLEILVWSIDFDEQYTSVCHCVAVRGVLFGAPPLQLVRAVRPTRDYRTLALLARAIREDWRLDLRTVIESQKLYRYDRRGRRLGEPVASQLLMRAITETHWGRLISPLDRPWAYINTATKRIYDRYYRTEEDCDDSTIADESDLKRYYDSPDSGGECHVPDILTTLQTAGFTDAIAVLNAKAQGRKLSGLQSSLTDGAGKLMSTRQVEALRGRLRRGVKRMRAVAMGASTWKPGSSSSTVYRERLPDGKLWQGLWTYSHKYQGEELEILRSVLREERKNLFKN
jgi:hypothetical protein